MKFLAMKTTRYIVCVLFKLNLLGSSYIGERHSLLYLFETDLRYNSHNRITLARYSVTSLFLAAD